MFCMEIIVRLQSFSSLLPSTKCGINDQLKLLYQTKRGNFEVNVYINLNYN
jgi:hypothetical protein